MKLLCALVGVPASWMLVDAKEDEWVLQLKRLIKAEKLNELKDVDPDQLRLYVAKRAGKWLTEKDIQGGVTDVAGLTELSGIHTPLAHFGFTEESVVNSAEDGPVHVLVKSPPPLGWLVSGSVQNALHTKGVRFRLYRLAASYLGHYDPDHVVDEHVQAFWYEDTTLRVHVLFKEERDALIFETGLVNETISLGSALNGKDVMTAVTRVPVSSTSLQRISVRDYDAKETDSPSQTGSMISSGSSRCEQISEEFKYQRIEDLKVFGPLQGADSCHIMSSAHCRRYQSYNKYDNDKNNRLALSSDMHNFYDGRKLPVPVMNIRVDRVSDTIAVSGRYEVFLVITALDDDHFRLISARLKEGAEVFYDRLEMRTSVFVESPMVFRECMDWKYRQTAREWENYHDMTSAVE